MLTGPIGNQFHDWIQSDPDYSDSRCIEIYKGLFLDPINSDRVRLFRSVGLNPNIERIGSSESSDPGKQWTPLTPNS